MNFKYKITYNGEQFLGNDFASIAKSISRSKGITLEEANIIVNKLATKLVPKVAKDFNPVAKKSISFREAVSGASSILKTTLGVRVDQNEINSRAAKCTNCPKLDTVSDCTSCGFSGKFKKWMNGMARVFGKGYIIPNNLENKFCSVCKCSLGAILPARIEDFNKEEESKNKSRPDFCWIKR